MSKSFIESLETRQLMSLTMDLRVVGGGKSATVHAVGDVVHMEIWAIAKGNDATGDNEALQIVDGSMLSTNVNGGAANGDLSAEVWFPFSAAGSTNGNQVDLDGDGDKDVGSNDDSSATGFFFARADELQGGGTVNGASQEWHVGDVDFKVTSLRKVSGSTNINWDIRNYISAGLWREDGIQILKNGISGTVLTGAPVVVHTDTGGTVTDGGISGQVYTDADGSGTKNGSETGRAGVTVFIDKDKDGILDAGESSTSTDGSGNYFFSNLTSGSYRVRVVSPSGFHVTAPASGFSDVSVGTSVVTGKNFGVKADTTSTNGSISGLVFNDGNKNGNFDAGDTILSNRKMFVDANSNGKLDTGEKTATSNASGVYTFSNLTPGTYRIRRSDLPAGYSYSEPVSGFYDVTVGSGQNITSKDFGAVLGTISGGNNASISGTVFNDANKNGSLDAGDSKLSARKMFIDANSNGKLDTGEKTATSNASGVYTFTGLAAGTYRIRRGDLPAGYSYTEPVSGFYDVTVSNSQVVTGKDFGAVLGTTGGGNTASISGSVFNDGNKNGKLDSGESLLSARKIYIDANNNGKLDSGEKTALSNSSGVYTFSGLAAGTYIIRRGDLPAGYKITDPSNGFYSITVVAGQVVTGKDLGAALI